MHGLPSRMSKDKLLSLGELAERTGLPMAFLRREAVVGAIPSIRAGRQLFFDHDAVRRALAGRPRRDGVRQRTGRVAHA